MRTRRRKITSETILHEGLPEHRFPRYAVLKRKRFAKECTVGGKKKILPAKYVKVSNGKLTGRTKGAFGGLKDLTGRRVKSTLFKTIKKETEDE